MTKVTVQAVQRGLVTFTIRGISYLVTHQWSEKAKQAMRDKQQGKKTKVRDARDPKAEVEAATYRTADGKPGVPGLAIKKAMIGAAHKDLGIEKALVKKAVFLHIDDPGGIIPLSDCSVRTIQEDSFPGREDFVRVGQGSADLRYRPQWESWEVEVCFEIDMLLLQPQDLATLINRAGFGVGIGEWRPEKEGEFGRFQIAEDKPFTVVAIDEGNGKKKVFTGKKN